MANKYTLTDNGIICGTGLSAKEIEEITGVPSRNISSFTLRGFTVHGRWKFLVEGKTLDPWEIEFDKKWNDMLKLFGKGVSDDLQ